MKTRSHLRIAFVIGLGLVPTEAVTAQDASGDDRPPVERHQPQQLRFFQGGRPDPEQMEHIQRQLELLQRRLPDGMRTFRFDSENGMVFQPDRTGNFLFLQSPDRLGLTLRPVPDVLRSHLDLPEEGGLVVVEVAEDSPAAGMIEKNDILLSLGELKLGESTDLSAALETFEGDTLTFTLLRGGEEQTVSTKYPRAPEAASERFILGVAIGTPDEAVRSQLGLPEDCGVIVMDVSPDSAAAKAGVQSNDILIELGGEPIVGAQELAEQVQENSGKTVELKLLRDGEEMTVEVTPEKRPALPLPSDAPQPQNDRRFFFGPGVMIDPETGELRPGPGGPAPFRNFVFPESATPELQRQLDELVEELKQLREEVQKLKQGRPERRKRS